MAEFLAWLDLTAPEGGLTEIDVVSKLEAFRAASGALRDISFDTISGAGPNGAIVHYRVTEASNRPVAPGELLLVDSGAQYLDGTTDVTRTVAVGPVPPEAVRPFTLVLKGLIAMSRLRWPEGLAGRDIDAIARAALWSAGYDYDHGTGHGVGAYLGVHEGPQSLSRRGLEPLAAGHDRLDRARLLPRGRLRHPHRDPRRRHAARRCPRAATGRCSASRP